MSTSDLSYSRPLTNITYYAYLYLLPTPYPPTTSLLYPSICRLKEYLEVAIPLDSLTLNSRL